MIEIQNSELFIGGCCGIDLAKKYGTPLYVMDEDIIRNNCRNFISSMNNYYKNGQVIFASKAFNCLEICRIMNQENMCLDVVSGGELYTALKAGFPAERIFFHGNNKSAAEIEMALDAGVRRIVVDNFHELHMLNKIAADLGKKANILFRIKPGIEAHTHSFIKTGQIDSKFGFALENGEAFQAIKLVNSMKNVEIFGLHCHIGSQIFDIEPFESAAKVILRFYLKIKDELGIVLDELNLGGGFGIKYVESDSPEEPDSFLQGVSSVVTKFCENNNIDQPKIFIEPGRSIVGSAGITLYEIGSVKEIENIRNYVAIDGGMCDNPRYALYGSEYTIMIANKADKNADYKATIAGKCCESGDLIQENIMIPKPESGDIMAVLTTGAYNYSMSSNYNRIGKPAVVMVSGGTSRVIIKRESFEDLIRNDL